MSVSFDEALKELSRKALDEEWHRIDKLLREANGRVNLSYFGMSFPFHPRQWGVPNA